MELKSTTATKIIVMTSGHFTSFPVADIWVDREKRQRRDLTDIDELAKSIAENGLIHPPVIKEDGELIVGERRWTAVKQLGWDSISVQFVEDLEPEELQAIELEENVRRKDVSWQEQCNAIERLHQIFAKKNEGWSDAKTGERLGLSQSVVTERRAVAKAIANGNKMIIEAPVYSTAKNIVKREQERRKTSLALEILATPAEEVPILNVDFTTWWQTYDGPPFNLIHCDFPYGINADKIDQGSGGVKVLGGYKDTFKTYTMLLEVLCQAKKLVADSAHLLFWFSMDYYAMTKERLETAGWKVDPFPLVWFKSDNTGLIPDSNRGPRRVYETCFFASRGDRKIVRAVGNCFPAPKTDAHHMSEKNLAMLTHFLRMVTDEYSQILDPTCGSGNALIAAKSLGASRCVGLERDKEFFARAVENWRQAQ